MNQMFRRAGVLFVLAAIGLLAFGILQGKAQVMGGENSAVPLVVPTALAGFPDIDRVPVYPGATVTEATNASAGSRHIVYEAEDADNKVSTFYRGMLAKRGWVLRSSSGQSTLYSWADVEPSTPWYLWLEVTVGLTFDGSKTLVNLAYGRYPDTQERLPLYRDAHGVTITHADTETSIASERVPVRVTDRTYLTTATPQEIAQFYNTSMPQYGWFFFDRSGSGTSNTQTGNISSQEGLYFTARHIGWRMNSIASTDLFVTATVQKDGQTLVRTHVEELETNGGGF